MTTANPASRQQPASVSHPLPGEVFSQATGESKTLVVIPHKCVGCRTCEVACSFAHATPEGLGHSRIRIHSVGQERFVQITCLQCVNAACAKVCPTEALKRNTETGAMEIDYNRCIGCGLCEAACPFGHMHFDVKARLPIKCDLCGGRPACATFCPHGALEWR